MEEDNSVDWLPPGWRMEVRLRKFGRKDKHYYAPSGQKFFSKLEVLCHLKKNLPTVTPQLEDGKDGRVGSTHSKENKEVSLRRIAFDACNNSDGCFPISAEKGKTGPYISNFSCISMDSGSGEENQVIEQNVEIHNGDNTNISCLFPGDGKTDIDSAAMVIAGESPAKKLQNEENGILHPSYTENNWNRNSRHQNSARTKVVVEKCVAEGLPEGWIKEIKVTNKNGNIRRDPYYTDPVSRYVFRSMKDVLRYLKTGYIGRLAFKPKDKSSSDVNVELEDEETPSPLTKKQKSAETCSSDNKEGMEDLPEKVVVAPTSSHMEELSVPEWAQHESKGCSSKLSEAVRLEHGEERNDCSRKDIFSVPEAKVISEESLQKQQLRGERNECGACPPEVTQFEPAPEESKDSKPSPQNVTQIKRIPAERFPSAKDATPASNVKEKATHKPNMPRRTSSRLAGIAVDPTVEIPSRGSRGNGKHICKEGTSQVKPEIQSTTVVGVRVDSYCIANDKDTPDGNRALIGVATRDVENGNMENEMVEKCVLPLELPSPEILQDPCIEFAIKTLTGMIDFDNLHHAFQPSNGMNHKNGDRTGANSETEMHENQERGVDTRMSPKKPSLLEEPIVKPIKEKTAADMPSSSSLGGSWSDPCIEFAIKTLTGAIPVGYGAGVQDMFRPATDVRLTHPGK